MGLQGADLERAPSIEATNTAAQVTSTVGSYAVRLVLGAVMGVVISRALGPSGRGDYSVAVITATIATALGHLSIGNASIVFWSSHRAAIAANNLWLGLPLGMTAGAIVGAVVLTLGPDVIPISSGWLIVLALATVPIAVSIVHLTMVVLLLGRVDVVNRALTAAAVVQCAALIGFGMADALSSASVVWIWALSGAIPFLLMSPAVRPHAGRTDLTLARRMIAVGAQYHAGVVALFLLLRVDVLLLNALASAASVGLYTLAVTLGEMSFAGTDALSRALLRRQAESPLDAAGDLAARTTRMALLVAVVSVAGLCAVSPTLVPALYGASFGESVPALFALAPGLVVYGATRPLGAYLLRLSRPHTMTALSVLALGVNVSANVLLIPRWGIVGCAIASSLAYTVLAGAQVAWFLSASGVRSSGLVPRWSDVARVLAAARSARS